MNSCHSFTNVCDVSRQHKNKQNNHSIAYVSDGAQLYSANYGTVNEETNCVTRTESC